jgi:Ca2+/Na+ antiporter
VTTTGPAVTVVAVTVAVVTLVVVVVGGRVVSVMMMKMMIMLLLLLVFARWLVEASQRSHTSEKVVGNVAQRGNLAGFVKICTRAWRSRWEPSEWMSSAELSASLTLNRSLFKPTVPVLWCKEAQS